MLQPKWQLLPTLLPGFGKTNNTNVRSNSSDQEKDRCLVRCCVNRVATADGCTTEVGVAPAYMHAA